MECIYLQNEKYLKYFEFHGCSITKKVQGNIFSLKIELPYEGYEILSKNILLLKSINIWPKAIYDIDFKLDIETSTVSEKFDVDYTYLSVSSVLRLFKSKGFIEIINSSIIFLVNELEYVKIYNIIYNVFLENNIEFVIKYKKNMELDDSRYIQRIKKYTLEEFTENKFIINNFSKLIQKVGYTCNEIDNLTYLIRIPFYKKELTIEEIISDVIYSYYLNL
jgi:hypothetical protein